MAEACDNLGKQLEPITSLVCDQDAQVPPLVLGHAHAPLVADAMRKLIDARPRPVLQDSNILTRPKE
jgi:hypothetical protein